MEVILMAYPKKNSCLVQMGHWGPRMSHPASQILIWCEDCLIIFRNEMGQERHGNYFNVFFWKKSHSDQFGHFGRKMVWCPLHFETGLRFFYQFYSIKGTKRYMKILLVVLWEKTSFGAIWSFQIIF